jgi:hypothetical protein
MSIRTLAGDAMSDTDGRGAESGGPLVYSVRRGWFAEPTQIDVSEHEDFEQLLEEWDFEPWARFGRPEAGFGITVYHRVKIWPPFLVELDASNGPAGAYDVVYADDLPSVMTLLREWVPVAEAATVPPTRENLRRGETRRPCP